MLFSCANPFYQSKFNKEKNKQFALSKNPKSLSGSGNISSNINEYGKLNFNFISQNDTSILFLKDIFGRKVIMLGIEKNKIIILDIYKKKLYDYDQIKDYFPPLVSFEVETFNKFLWNSLIESTKNENIQIRNNKMIFKSVGNINTDLFNHLNIESSSLLINININDRSINDKKINVKKLWNNFN